MPVQAARTLHQEVDRGEVSHHHIEVDVEGLLDDLRRDHHERRGPLDARSGRTERGKELLFDYRTFHRTQARMKQHEFRFLRERLAKRCEPLLRCPHRVAHDARAAAVAHEPANDVGNLDRSGRILNRHRLKMHGSWRARVDNAARDYSFTADRQQARIVLVERRHFRY